MKSKVIKIILPFLILFLCYLWFGHPIVTYHNYQLKKAVCSIHSQETTLNEIVPFAWDKVYTFGPYTSKEEIQKEIGFHSNAIKESVSEDMVQLLFVKNNAVTASICNYSSNLGYRIDFTGHITFEENAKFTVSWDSDVIILKKI
ncbi:MAG: hypothetical protein KHZ62_01255 [Clostridiales bacterium]|nr:hypothetical protein [Clostridiales bacterium]